MYLMVKVIVRTHSLISEILSENGLIFHEENHFYLSDIYFSFLSKF